jgi:hypothetical protein
MFERTKPIKETRPERRTDLEITLCQAMQSKKRVRLHYKNEFHFRSFEPYILYLERTGKVLVHGMQTKDDLDRAQGKDLRSFEVRLLNSVILIKEAFEYHGTIAPFKLKLGTDIICTVDSLSLY